jgi:hypothetical protein
VTLASDLGNAVDRAALSPLLSSFERHLRAENRSKHTTASYLDSLRQAEAAGRCGSARASHGHVAAVEDPGADGDQQGGNRQQQQRVAGL